jgi:hypothetical protein
VLGGRFHLIERDDVDRDLLRAAALEGDGIGAELAVELTARKRLDLQRDRIEDARQPLRRAFLRGRGAQEADENNQQRDGATGGGSDGHRDSPRIWISSIL